MKNIFWIINRHTNRVEILTGFSCWEEVQGTFAVGFLMSDGNSANGIGRSKSMAEFIRKANHGGTTILVPDENPFQLEIDSNGVRAEVGADVWRSWTGARYLNGYRVQGQRFLFGTNEPAKTPLESSSQDWSPCPYCGESSENCDCEPVCPETHKSW